VWDERCFYPAERTEACSAAARAEPQFKNGDRVCAVATESQGSIKNGPMIRMPISGPLYLVRFDEGSILEGTLLIPASNLRLVERWEPCPYKHRHAATATVCAGGAHEGHWERLVGENE